MELLLNQLEIQTLIQNKSFEKLQDKLSILPLFQKINKKSYANLIYMGLTIQNVPQGTILYHTKQDFLSFQILLQGRIGLFVPDYFWKIPNILTSQRIKDSQYDVIDLNILKNPQQLKESKLSYFLDNNLMTHEQKYEIVTPFNLINWSQTRLQIFKIKKCCAICLEDTKILKVKDDYMERALTEKVRYSYNLKTQTFFQSGYFEDLSEDLQNKLLSKGVIIKIDPNKVITDCILIIKGNIVVQMQSYIKDQHGKEFQIWKNIYNLTNGNVANILELSQNKNPIYRLKTIEKTKALRWERAQLLQIIDQDESQKIAQNIGNFWKFSLRKSYEQFQQQLSPRDEFKEQQKYIQSIYQLKDKQHQDKLLIVENQQKMNKEKQSIILNDSLKFLSDRLMMQNHMKVAQDQIIKDQQEYFSKLIFKSNSQHKKFRDVQSVKEADAAVLKTITFENHNGKVVRCKRIELNNNLNSVNKKFGILNINQAMTSNLRYFKSRKIDLSPIGMERTDRYHNLEGQIARKHRKDVIQEFSKIDPVIRAKPKWSRCTSPRQSDGSSYTMSPQREAIQKVLVISHRNSNKNIMPSLPNDPMNVETIISDLDRSLRSSSLHETSKGRKERLPYRFGGGFTKKQYKEIQNLYFLDS
ncbi:hypothetical protein pb186bvf_003437 [Paramecium bursaria]